MRFIRKLFGKNYLLNKETKVVHDLTRNGDSDCYLDTRAIKHKNRKYLTFNEFVRDWSYAKVGGCDICLPGFEKRKEKMNINET